MQLTADHDERPTSFQRKRLNFSSNFSLGILKKNFTYLFDQSIEPSFHGEGTFLSRKIPFLLPDKSVTWIFATRSTICLPSVLLGLINRNTRPISGRGLARAKRTLVSVPRDVGSIKGDDKQVRGRTTWKEASAKFLSGLNNQDNWKLRTPAYRARRSRARECLVALINYSPPPATPPPLPPQLSNPNSLIKAFYRGGFPPLRGEFNWFESCPASAVSSPRKLQTELFGLFIIGGARPFLFFFFFFLKYKLPRQWERCNSKTIDSPLESRASDRHRKIVTFFFLLKF